MALPGPAQNPNKIGYTPNADWTDVPDVPYAKGELRDLPARLVPGEADESGASLLTEGGWALQTATWWSMVRTMPHASLWTEPDWMFASDTAVLKDSFYTGSANSSDKVEMRRREDLMGLSTEARRKARIRYVVPVIETATLVDANNVTNIRSTRRRDLLGDDS